MWDWGFQQWFSDLGISLSSSFLLSLRLCLPLFRSLYLFRFDSNPIVCRWVLCLCLFFVILFVGLDPPLLLHPNQLPHLRLLSTETPRIEAPHQYYNIYKKRAPNPQRIRQISNGSRRI